VIPNDPSGTVSDQTPTQHPGRPGTTGLSSGGPGGRRGTPFSVVAVLVAAAVIGGGFVLSACGGDDDSTETSAESGTSGDDEAADPSGDEPTDDASAGDGSSDGEPNGDGSAAAEAEAVVRNYFQAVVDQDCQAMFAAVTESSWTNGASSADQAVSQCEDAVAAGELDIEGEITLDNIVVTEESADRVTFDVTETIAGEQLTEPFTVVNEGGEWKIDLSAR
jgi:hypothetical protein